MTLALSGVNFWGVAELGPAYKGPKFWENKQKAALFLKLFTFVFTYKSYIYG